MSVTQGHHAGAAKTHPGREDLAPSPPPQTASRNCAAISASLNCGANISISR